MSIRTSLTLNSVHNPGLYPTDDLEAAKCDAVIDSIVDFGMRMRPTFMEKDEAKKVSGGNAYKNCTMAWSQSA